MPEVKALPLISVVIPAYNAERYITKAINSVLNQTHSNLEIIVVNDGSQDQTEWAVSQIDDTRIRIITQSNGGMSNARNAGIRAATGDFIAYLDADDYWMSEKLEKQLKVLLENRNLGFCSTQTRVETPEGSFVNLWPCPAIETSTLHTIFSHNSAIAGSASSILAKMSLQKEAGFFDETLKGLEDTDMWMRFSALSDYCCIPETLTVILKRSDSVSRNLTNMFTSATRMYKKNRSLLDKSAQKKFWRSAYASMLCDFAKWEARNGLKKEATMHILFALTHDPINKFRICLSLLLSILLNKKF